MTGTNSKATEPTSPKTPLPSSTSTPYPRRNTNRPSHPIKPSASPTKAPSSSSWNTSPTISRAYSTWPTNSLPFRSRVSSSSFWMSWISCIGGDTFTETSRAVIFWWMGGAESSWRILVWRGIFGGGTVWVAVVEVDLGAVQVPLLGTRITLQTKTPPTKENSPTKSSPSGTDPPNSSSEPPNTDPPSTSGPPDASSPKSSSAAPSSRERPTWINSNSSSTSSAPPPNDPGRD
mmetsp:Transcript_3876/g.7684  ORF Transcript_3876/g.7684 Transcript_3876/m.7684 type:complete len:233 (-) Transcript_3876:709-1407(-)